MAMQKWERAFELGTVGVVLFIGLVSMFYSWIDSAFGGKVNIYLLTATAAIATALIVYIIYRFDKN
ncbi:hypothetical protein M1316_02975 [Candidatus Parvarchaeota archaeon]|jgi:hypothetical protein|nr:hypothetical protein [Candidatus Parvarchaeota archaeon]